MKPREESNNSSSTNNNTTTSTTTTANNSERLSPSTPKNSSSNGTYDPLSDRKKRKAKNRKNRSSGGTSGTQGSNNFIPKHKSNVNGDGSIDIEELRDEILSSYVSEGASGRAALSCKQLDIINAMKSGTGDRDRVDLSKGASKKFGASLQPQLNASSSNVNETNQAKRMWRNLANLSRAFSLFRPLLKTTISPIQETNEDSLDANDNDSSSISYKLTKNGGRKYYSPPPSSAGRNSYSGGVVNKSPSISSINFGTEGSASSVNVQITSKRMPPTSSSVGATKAKMKSSPLLSHASPTASHKSVNTNTSTSTTTTSQKSPQAISSSLVGTKKEQEQIKAARANMSSSPGPHIRNGVITKRGVHNVGWNEKLRGLSIITNNIVLGGRSEASDKSLLLKYGVTHVLNSCKQLDCYFDSDFTYLKVPAMDTNDYDITGDHDITSRFIQRVEALDGRVLVHCVAGVSRSVSFVLMHLVKAHAVSLNQAYLHVKDVRPFIHPNDAFLYQLAIFETETLGFTSVGKVGDASDFGKVFEWNLKKGEFKRGGDEGKLRAKRGLCVIL